MNARNPKLARDPSERIGALGWVCLAATAAVTALAVCGAAYGQTPAYAPGVQPAPDLTPAKTPYVVANELTLYKVPAYDPDKVTGITLKRGDRPEVLGEANRGTWILVGKDHKGIGYASRGLMCPQSACANLRS